jgi:hypothetical protein
MALTSRLNPRFHGHSGESRNPGLEKASADRPILDAVPPAYHMPGQASPGHDVVLAGVALSKRHSTQTRMAL